MDVRCDRCQTEYEFDENYLTPNGVAVKCTTCGNVFKVRRSITQPLIATNPVTNPVSSSTSVPAAAPQGENRLSLVRWRAGQTLPLKDVTELQRWVVERKVTRDDEVSFGGEGFRKLGSLPELNSFFQLVDAADRAQLQASAPVPAEERVEPRPPVSPALINTTPGFPDAPKALGNPPQLTPEPAWTGQRRATSPMNMATLVDEELDEDVSRLKGSRMGIWLLVLILVGGGAGGGWWYLNNSGPPRMTAKPHPPPAVPVPPPDPVPAQTATPPPGEPPPSPEPAAPPGTVPAAAPIPPPPGGAPPVAGPDSQLAPAGPAAAQATASAAPVPQPTPPPPTPAPTTPAPTTTPKAEAEVPPAKGAAAAAAAAAAAQAPSTQPPIASKTDFAGYMARGRRLIETRPNDALEMFKKASQLVPSSPEPYAARGLAYTDMQSWDLAIESFNAALTRNPEFSDAVMGLAEAYRYKGDKEKAQINYQRYLQMAPSGPDARVARVQLEILKGIAPAPQ